jgi:hypothetical protein
MVTITHLSHVGAPDKDEETCWDVLDVLITEVDQKISYVLIQRIISYAQLAHASPLSN